MFALTLDEVLDFESLGDLCEGGVAGEIRLSTAMLWLHTTMTMK